ncbi:MAG: isochorismatase family cysteine hydrolase [Candidatus Bathyarchaeia archaeon]
MGKKAILVIDMVNDFITGKLGCERAKRIIPNIKRLIENARKKGVPVIYCNDAHLPIDFELKKWGSHAIKGTEGAKVITELEPTEKDFIIEKRTYSGFFETGLDTLLRELNVNTICITGIHTHICVKHTAADAFFRGYKIIVVEDAVEAISEKDHEEGLAYMKSIYGADLKKVDEIIKEL